MFGKKELQRELEQKEQQIQELVSRVLEKEKFAMSTMALDILAVHLEVAVERIRTGHAIKSSDGMQADLPERKQSAMISSPPPCVKRPVWRPKGTEYLTKPGRRPRLSLRMPRRGQRLPRSRPGTSRIISGTPQIRCAAKPKTTPASLKITSISASASSRRRKR